MKRKTFLFGCVCCILVLAFLSGCKGQDYQEAIQLFDNGSYDDAKEIFNELTGYKDTDSYLKEISRIAEEEQRKREEEMEKNYESAVELYVSGDWDAALPLFQQCGDYEEAKDYVDLINSPEGHIREACSRAAESDIKSRLKDPSSYESVSMRVSVGFNKDDKTWEATVFHTYSGTNSFGGRLQNTSILYYTGQLKSYYVSVTLDRIS